MPETPKFLMAKGETQKAMEVFAWVYSLNTGKSPDSFPVILIFATVSIFGKQSTHFFKVKCLIEEKTKTDSTNNESNSKIISAVKQTGELFSSDYRWIALLLCAIEIGVVFRCVKTISDRKQQL